MVTVQHLIIRDRAPGVRRHAAHRRHEARFHPTLHLVVGPVGADRADEIIPLDLVGIGLGLREGPEHILRREVVSLVNPRLRRDVALLRNHREALRTVRPTGVFRLRSRLTPAFKEKLRAVAKRIFHRVGVEILIDAVAAIVPPAVGLRLHRPRALHPRTFVDIVNVEIAERPAARPHETVESLNLIHQVGLVGRLRRRRKKADRPVQPVGAHHQ